jgi:S-adenosylmethionine hydrolase
MTLKPLLTLLTDFGLKDPFAAEMKAVIYSICPDAHIIDITHLVEKFDVRMGSFILTSSVPYFPAGTVHVAVVDPGVGSERRAIAIETERSILVGPDNGVLIPAARREGVLHVYELKNTSLMRQDVSATFHGRDIFAPAAAHLACGTPCAKCGPEISDFIKPSFAEPKFDRFGAVCEVLHVDSFGNVVTNIPHTQLSKLGLRRGDEVSLILKGRHFKARFVRTYADLGANELGVLVSSHGFLEVSMKEKSAAKRIQAKSGYELRVIGA